MVSTKENYLERYRALGKKLEIERLRISEMINEDFENPLDKHRISQIQFRDKCNELLLELNELEELLFEVKERNVGNTTD